MSGTLYAGDRSVKFTTVTLAQWPDQFRTTTNADTGMRRVEVIQVVNGDKAWICDGAKTMEAPAQTATDLRQLAHVQHVSNLLPLRDARLYGLKMLAETKVNDKPVVGFLVTAKDRSEVKLYFDKENYLLVKREFKGRSTGKEALREEFLSNYKAIDGVQRPHTQLIHQDGKKYAEATLDELKFLKKIEPDEFKQP